MSQFNLDDFNTASGASTGIDANSILNQVMDFGDVVTELPDGKYRGRVTGVKVSVTQKGDAMLGLMLTVEQGDEYDGLVRWDNWVLVPNAIRIVARKYKALTGLSFPAVTPLALGELVKEKTCIFQLKTKADDDGTPVQRVSGIYPDTQPTQNDFDFNV